jgi:hypothetical protein
MACLAAPEQDPADGRERYIEEDQRREPRAAEHQIEQQEDDGERHRQDGRQPRHALLQIWKLPPQEIV